MQDKFSPFSLGSLGMSVLKDQRCDRKIKTLLSYFEHHCEMITYYSRIFVDIILA
jgi:hypothetical protein